MRVLVIEKNRLVGSPDDLPRLFAPRDDWWLNACLNYSPDTWDLYASGYARGAGVLLAHVNSTGQDLDVLIYPTVFLIRHYCELRLKELIRATRDLLGESGDFPMHHRILDLWRTARQLLEAAFPGETKQQFDEAEALVMEFANLDRDAMSFRYPEHRNHAETLSGVTHINYGQLSDGLAKLTSLLEGATCYVAQALQVKADMRGDFP